MKLDNSKNKKKLVEKWYQQNEKESINILLKSNEITNSLESLNFVFLKKIFCE